MHPALDHRVRFCGHDHIQAGPWTGAPGKPFFAKRQGFVSSHASHAHKLPGILKHVIADRHFSHDALQVNNLLGVEHGIWLFWRLAGSHLHDLNLLTRIRIIHLDVEHEPVELRLRQWIRALLLNRVLRREHEERIRQVMILAAN